MTTNNTIGNNQIYLDRIKWEQDKANYKYKVDQYDKAKNELKKATGPGGKNQFYLDRIKREQAKADYKFQMDEYDKAKTDYKKKQKELEKKYPEMFSEKQGFVVPTSDTDWIKWKQDQANYPQYYDADGNFAPPEKFVVPPSHQNMIAKNAFKRTNPQYFDSDGNFKNPEKFMNPTDDMFIINFTKENPQFFTDGFFDPKKAVILDRGLDQFASPEYALGAGLTTAQLDNIRKVNKGGDPDKTLMEFAIEFEKSKRADSQFLDAMTDSGIAFVPVWSTVHAWDEMGTKGRTASIALDVLDVLTLSIPLKAGGFLKGGPKLAKGVADTLDVGSEISLYKGENALVAGLDLLDPKIAKSTLAVNKAQQTFANSLIKVEEAQNALKKLSNSASIKNLPIDAKNNALSKAQRKVNDALKEVKFFEKALGANYDKHVSNLGDGKLTEGIPATPKDKFIADTKAVITGAFDYDPKTQKATDDFLDLTSDIGETVNSTKAREKTLRFVEGGNVRKNLTEQQNIKIAKNQIVNKALKITGALDAIDVNTTKTAETIAERVRKDSDILKRTLSGEGGVASAEQLRTLKTNVSDGIRELQAIKTADGKLLQTARNALQDAIDTFPKNKSSWNKNQNLIAQALEEIKAKQGINLNKMKAIDLNPPWFRPSGDKGSVITPLKPVPTGGGTGTKVKPKFDYKTIDFQRVEARGFNIPGSPLIPAETEPFIKPDPKPGPGPDPSPGPSRGPDTPPKPGPRTLPTPGPRPTPGPGGMPLPGPTTRPTPGPGGMPLPPEFPTITPTPTPTPPPGPGPTPTPPPGPGPAPLPPPFPSGGPGPQPQPFGQPAPTPPPPPGTPPPPPPGTTPPDADKVTTKKTPPRGDPKKTPKQQKQKTPRKPGERFIASMGVKLGSVFAKVNFNTGKVTRSRKNKWGIKNVKGKGSVVKSATILSYDNDPPTQFQLDNAVPGKTLVLGKNPRLIENKNLRRQNRRKRKSRRTRRGKGI